MIGKYPFDSFTTKAFQPKFPGEQAEIGRMTAMRLYTASTSPSASNDGYDTAGIAQAFDIGDYWEDRTTKTVYRCTDNTQSAAVWVISSATNRISVISTATGSISSLYTFYSVTYTTSGAVTLTLPSASTSLGITYWIADSGANSGTNAITINRAGSDTIIGDTVGETSVEINSNGDVIGLIAINSTTWKVI